ncbi:MAG: putative lipid II flippase FtsW [bacterium]
MSHSTGQKRSRRSADRTILTVTLLLVGLGTVMVYSASSSVAAASHGDPAFYLKRHLVRAVIGLVIMAVLSRARYVPVARLGRPLLILSFVGLVLVLMPSLGGVGAKGANRWMALGPLTFQPSDLARFALILWLADTLTRRREDLGAFREGLLPILAPVAGACVLILAEPDFSTAAALALICGGMIYLAGARLVHLGALALSAAAPVWVFLMSSPYRRTRISAFLEGGSDLQGANYQVWQSLIGLGSGGILGRGLGNSVQKLRFLPEPFNDFIFSIVGEELGFAGAVLTLVLFLVLVVRGLRIARHAPDITGALLAAGISMTLGLYVLLNVGVVTSTLPATGLALPFISYGGSSLLFSLAGVGVLLSVSREAALEDLPGEGGRA